jgi:bis(5'-nucleosidyl)-tetraphosphatase
MGMKLERSAGLVLYRTMDGQRLYLLLNYGRHWDFPKGHVEAGEDDVTAARRETVEETGISDVTLHDGFAKEIAYIFRGRGGELIKKTVIFFAAQTLSETVTLSHEHVGYEFVPYDAALKRVTFPSARAILRDAERFLNGALAE